VVDGSGEPSSELDDLLELSWLPIGPAAVSTPALERLPWPWTRPGGLPDGATGDLFRSVADAQRDIGFSL
jgi:hypothetical protein